MDRIIFCDFDGTITVEETFVAILKKFSPKVSGELIPQMYTRKLTLRQGVRRILESIPSSCYAEILDFSRNREIRPGFEAFLDFLEAESVPLVVVSGGLKEIVKTVMGELVNRVQEIHAIDVNTTSEYLQVFSEFEGGTELVAKVQVMDRYPCDEKIAIGDSLTDLNMALQTPMVFARDRLAKYLDEQEKSYIPWDDFFEIRDYLKKLWN
ncbi:HAD-IB family phosphatase [Mastigocoleus testarum]|uniref:2-hydroxy-3-keto-5-methylthiopentenyl-1-phosphate phosphatase n=1 Tax=Mastigocoleus testarum BC008 TaxID=371196 RepID=A0A0V7ZP19_9CYAN|nr:HAD-IB family phosphatase [Mastigocoleus testarum]KST66329.1 2-hydroxy-3-keto-5-methylthiopentenyl-1-phosphate phosphatase [Mastigocoleus testarum BC008]KST66650.1 2-hydroxy-3-keto-5-methylthiopentenyl-1-phosphate phosphatase [Mastigocoleus testarum BC008]